ncbi:hypothetical protein [Sinorhizobium sp. BJ1]|uniref:hypothetical protein n=1 Tax=Sinorhizobium sp. BJ1 TaxID=2035455 RepID=UPI000BEA6119|nr:hypothetical protein [Sinorhizobium sp. BJ1]
MILGNATRGLALAGTDFVYLDEGAYGVVFVNRDAGRIRKVYRRQQDEAHVRAVFKAEADAYIRAASAPALLCLIPAQFQLCTLQQVIDRDGNDVSAEFSADLAFETEFVNATFHKIGNIGGDEARCIHRLFLAAGIKHTTDMSVSLTADGRIYKVIDFAVEEHEIWHQD